MLSCRRSAGVSQLWRIAVPQALQQPRPHFDGLDSSIRLPQEGLSLCHHGCISQLPSQPGHELQVPCNIATSEVALLQARRMGWVLINSRNDRERAKTA